MTSPESKALSKAFAAKDEVIGYLTNLTRLKADGVITEDQHASLRNEYEQRLHAANLEIARIKGDIKKRLEAVTRDLETQRWELGKLEVKYKVGELPLDRYRNADGEVRARIEELESASGDLKKLAEANSPADVAHAATTPAAPPQELPATRSVARAAGAEPVPAKLSKEAAAPSSTTGAALSQEGILTPWTKVPAMAGGALLLISILLPWVAPSATLGASLGTESGMGVSIIIAAAGIIGGLAAVGAVFLPAPKPRAILHIVLGIAALGVLLAIVLTGTLPLLSAYVRKLLVLREGLYLYVIAALVLIVTGPLELRRR